MSNDLAAARASEPWAAIDEMRRRGIDPAFVEIALGAFDAPRGWRTCAGIAA